MSPVLILQRPSLQNFPGQRVGKSLKLPPHMKGHTLLYLLKFWLMAQIKSAYSNVLPSVSVSNHLWTCSSPAPLLSRLNKNLRTRLSDLYIRMNLRNDSRPTYLTCTSTTFWQVFTDFNRLQMPLTERWFWLRLRKIKKAISWSLKSHRTVLVEIIISVLHAWTQFTSEVAWWKTHRTTPEEGVLMKGHFKCI